MSQHNVAALHEAIAAAIPDRDCLLWRDRRFTWAEITDRTRRLAAVLAAADLGVHGDPASCSASASPHDHIALYLHNGNEYLEGMLGAWKARACSININYRYVADELRYVLADSGARAVIYHGTFAATLAEVLDDLPEIRLLLHVDDDSGAPLLPGAVRYEDALAAATPVQPAGLDPDDLYIVYTGGTTGSPKGVLWRQADFIDTCLSVRGTTEEIVEAARRGTLRSLPAPPFMHGAAHWNAWSSWLTGGTIVIQDEPDRLHAADILRTCERHRVTSLLIVGDAFARPLVDELHAAAYDLDDLRFLLTGGAVLSGAIKTELLARLPNVRIVDLLGSSETGRQGVQNSTAASGVGAGTFTRQSTAAVLSDDLTRRLAPGEDEIGWLAQAGRVPRGYLGDAAKTARTFPEIGGERWAVAGDRARLLADGAIELHGRESVCINTGGEKVFAEEVEQALKGHPAVYDALVVGRPSERWGQEVVAVVHLRPGHSPADDELRDTCAQHLARYKLPKAFVRVDAIERSPSGKPDYRWATEQATNPPTSG